MSQEKTEQPSARRLRKAREDGEHPLSTAVVQSAAALAICLLVPALMVDLWHETHTRLLGALEGRPVDPRGLLYPTTLLLAPLLLAAAASASVAGVLQTQGYLSPKRVTPQLDSLNPIEGAKRLFQASRLFSVARAALATVLVTVIALGLLERHAPALVASIGQTESAVVLGGVLGMRLLWWGVGLSLVLAGVDALISYQGWLKRHRMSHDELKREHRESEGDPDVKAQRRGAYQEMLRGAELGGVKNATVVIVNPTHFATALRYHADLDDAPVVLAKGRDHEARALIAAARAYGVPVVQDVGVARALYALQLGDEIPEALFQAVAEILQALWSTDAGGQE